MLSKKIPVLILAASLTLLAATPIIAAEGATSAGNTRPVRVRPTVAEVRRERIYNLQEKTATKRATREATLEERRTNIQNRGQTRIASREARIADHRARIEAKKATMSAEIKAKREAFHERLAEIKDERKQRILENLVTRYAHINERWTNHFLHVLDRLAQILDKLEMRMQETAANSSVDTSGVPEAIDGARAAIADAQTTVENQAAKVYTIEISLQSTESPSADTVGDETTLRDDAQAVHETLRADLAAARSTVKAAREAVHAAFQALEGTSRAD